MSADAGAEGQSKRSKLIAELPTLFILMCVLSWLGLYSQIKSQFDAYKALDAEFWQLRAKAAR